MALDQYDELAALSSINELQERLIVLAEKRLRR
jgi:hypothetical protein